MPHLTEAVSIDPENAKYRHTLAIAKYITGDAAGAREDFREAALLEREDAEDRFHLRMQLREKEKKAEEERCVPERSEMSDGAGAPQVRSAQQCVEKSPRHRERKRPIRGARSEGFDFFASISTTMKTCDPGTCVEMAGRRLSDAVRREVFSPHHHWRTPTEVYAQHC